MTDICHQNKGPMHATIATWIPWDFFLAKNCADIIQRANFKIFLFPLSRFHFLMNLAELELFSNMMCDSWNKQKSVFHQHIWKG